MPTKFKILMYTLIALVVLAGVFVFIRFVLGGDEDTWICDQAQGQWVKHGNPSTAKPTTTCNKK